MMLKGAMNKLKNRFFIRTAIIILVLLCSSCMAAESTEMPAEFESLSYQPVPTNMPEISAIEGNAEIRFPASAHEIHAYTSGLRDIFIMVRFSINASELPEFINGTLCDQPLAKFTPLPGATGNKFDWWVPEQAKFVKQCSGKNEHSHQQVIIDMSDEEVYIVYVSTSTY